MHSVLEKDGVLVSEEATASSGFCFPENSSYQKWKALWTTLEKAKGIEPGCEVRLPEFFRQTGFGNIKLNLVQPVLSTQQQRGILAYDVIETQATALEARFFRDQSEIASLLEQLKQLAKDEDSFVAYVRKTQVKGQK